MTAASPYCRNTDTHCRSTGLDMQTHRIIVPCSDRRVAEIEAFTVESELEISQLLFSAHKLIVPHSSLR